MIFDVFHLYSSLQPKQVDRLNKHLVRERISQKYEKFLGFKKKTKHLAAIIRFSKNFH